MSKLDKSDQAILKVLRGNARESIKGIAAKTGLARSTVRNRIERLETSGTITGYRVELKDTSVNGIEAFLLAHLTTTPSLSVIDMAAGFPEVKRCYSLSGEVDLIIEVHAENTERLNIVRDAVSALDTVASLTTSIILNKNFEEK
ncbi:MAG: Lrp/AsnC family transcriptional regulator [Rhodospirillales bacterium]|jgi:Lrp/AsnC family transcriptional regulator, leucine-responsive regulatory protein|nr:Lrp/AsnC family transcriptional regulator [Rhodospirillales bacterium]